MKCKYSLLLVLAFGLSGADARAEVQALVLQQNSAYLGKQVMYLTPTHIALKSEVATILVRVKDDRLFMYNDKKKCYVDKPYGEWARRVGGQLASNPKAILTKGPVAPICGWKCTQYHLGPKKGQITDECEFWVTPDSKLPEATLAAVAKFGDFPHGVGLPLRAIKIVHGKRINGIDTTKIERKAVPDSIFKVPTGYRKVDDEVEVLLAEEDEGMEGLLDEMSSGPAKAKPPKPKK